MWDHCVCGGWACIVPEHNGLESVCGGAVCVVSVIVVLKYQHIMCVCECGGDACVWSVAWVMVQWWLDCIFMCGVSPGMLPRYGGYESVLVCSPRRQWNTCLGSSEGSYTIRARELGKWGAGVAWHLWGASIPGNWDSTLPGCSWGPRTSQLEAIRTVLYPTSPWPLGMVLPL